MTRRKPDSCLSTLERLAAAVTLQYQPLMLSGLYDPAQGKFGQGTAFRPDGTPCDRHTELGNALNDARALLDRLSPRKKAPCAP